MTPPRTDPSKAELIEFVRGKSIDALIALAARDRMEKVWRGGTDESWAIAAELHPSTAGKSISKKERLKEADTHYRIAMRLRREVEMFKALLRTLEGTTGT